MAYQLGIDTGGTYTDAVIVNDKGELLAKHKSLTTAFDLTLGIGDAVAHLPPDLLGQINLVALSTTLSTNSVIEGRGAPVSVLLPGYSSAQITRSGLEDIIEPERIHGLSGGHSAMGDELVPLDVDAARSIIHAQKESVTAFAVSAMFGTRNASHELALRQLIMQLSDKPVVCGHELATSLGAPARALTVTLNARMIIYVKALIESVECILLRHAIDAPLMVVKGDGSLINVATARMQPVATVLSGPAASVIGACKLSGKPNAIVVDMGGTTTDVAIITNGQPDLCEDGARIGDWKPMVEAIRVFSIGLGGDSEVRFNGKMEISTRRVVPVSLLAYQYPQVLSALERQLNSLSNARHNRFALRLQSNELQLQQLNAIERRAWDALAHGPVELDLLAESDRAMTRAIARLERLGLVIYSGFTPSDATHVLGLSSHWDAQAAKMAALLWARQMRYLYGCGTWSLDNALAPCQDVVDLVVQQICQTLIKAGLHQFDAQSERNTHQHAQMLTDLILQSKSVSEMSDPGNNSQAELLAPGAESGLRGPPLFTLKFANDYPIVAVGGPAADYFPEVARLLDIELHMPRHAEVANAYGAVLGAVVQQVRITVTQPVTGRFHVFYKDTPFRFDNLNDAQDAARELAVNEARELAESAGAGFVEVRLHEEHNHVKHDIDGELFISSSISAIATGRPAIHS